MLDHIMQTAAFNATKQFESLEKVSQNVANMNTYGFKNVRFDQYLDASNQLNGTQREDYAQGSVQVTGRPLDVAIEGPGFLPVTQPDGTTAYTRDGSLALNADGYIVSNRGDIVGNGIKIPDNYQEVLIDKTGDVKVKTTAKSDPFKVGHIDLVRFNNPEGLQSIGYNKLLMSDDSGQPIVDTDSKIKQGNLERSNVNVFYQVDNILRLNASVISNFRIVKFSDDLYRQAVNLRQ
ncbi:MAG: flagellar hook-basal body complex protein [Vampirovibrionales bacterium]|nr:flagellar hook-basal body complex protein [Vampirovibrionales bacterium]